MAHKSAYEFCHHWKKLSNKNNKKKQPNHTINTSFMGHVLIITDLINQNTNTGTGPWKWSRVI